MAYLKDKTFCTVQKVSIFMSLHNNCTVFIFPGNPYQFIIVAYRLDQILIRWEREKRQFSKKKYVKCSNYCSYSTNQIFVQKYVLNCTFVDFSILQLPLLDADPPSKPLLQDHLNNTTVVSFVSPTETDRKRKKTVNIPMKKNISAQESWKFPSEHVAHVVYLPWDASWPLLCVSPSHMTQ